MALSLVTNLAAGVTGDPLDHHEVLAAGKASAGRVGDLLTGILSALWSVLDLVRGSVCK